MGARDLSIFALGVGLLGLSGPADADGGTSRAVEETVAAACAVRGLTAKRPIVVRPMAEREDGYTPGIGNVVWHEQHAEQWRAGWCAVGVYCAGSGPVAEPATSPAEGSLGLYDPVRDVVFVRDLQAPTAREVVAHETVHALQYQNFPTLSIPNSWHNRDLSAAVDAAVEGDAHLVGWWFDATEQLGGCSIEPHTVRPGEALPWGWHPQEFWAHELFADVFGPSMVLRRWRDGGVSGVDDLIRNPPLSTRDVLAGGAIRGVEFISLPDGLVTPELAQRGCTVGLTNTLGALGIWGLLAQHGEVDSRALAANEPPALIDLWLGDRFAHVACPGERDDELAWVTRWRDNEAASEFAQRYRAIAESVRTHGGVHAAAPMAFVRGRVVVVVTPGLRGAVAALGDADVRHFSNFQDWLASGCYPQSECDAVEPPATAPGQVQGACGGEASPVPRLDEWLARVRRTQSGDAVAPAELGAQKTAMDALSPICTAQNDLDNADLAMACNTAYWGLHHWLKRHCAAEPHSEPARTTSASKANLWQTFSSLYGPALAEQRLAEKGMAGLLALANSPPLSTLAVFLGRDVPVDFIRLPQQRLAALGCEVRAASSYGVLDSWLYLTELGSIADAAEPPEFLLNLRGDRLLRLQCGEQEHYLWLTRWANDASARRYLAVVPARWRTRIWATSTAAGTHTVSAGSTVPRAAREAVEQEMELRSYATFPAWQSDGCFPQAACATSTMRRDGSSDEDQPYRLSR